ncbi:MAG: sugar phosphate nucleotidyltransferase [Bacteroidota bacterium]
MKAVLMAGGSGTRLRPLTCDIPKPMVPMLNRPMTEHIIDLLKKHGIRDIIITLYYLPQVIQNYFGDGREFGVNITYAIEEKMPLGTAGCVRAIADQLDDTFIVISGDSLTDTDLTAALDFHKSKGSLATLVLTRVENPMDLGVVITDGEGRIERFLEKPSSSEIFSDTINTGTYILEPEVLYHLEADKEFDFSKDLFPLLLKRNDPMFGYIASCYWEDVGSLQAYRQSHYDICEGKLKLDHGYTEYAPGIWIGEGTKIDPTAKLSGPLFIGSNCQIGPNVQMTAGTVVGDNVIIGEGSSLKRPVIWNNVYIAEGVALRGCVIGKNTSLKRYCEVLEGAIIANDCVVGEKSIVKPNVKVWPTKTIDNGATVASSLIWGTNAQRGLFGASGVNGLVNIEITPEFAVKLGAAYGATLPPDSTVFVSRDASGASRMINRGLISGLMSVGINIQNLETTAIPLSRYMAPGLGCAGGIHTRIHPNVTDEVCIEFLDNKGMDIPRSTEKKIDGNFFKEDFRRAQLTDIGEISFPSRVHEYYKEGFHKAMSGVGQAIRDKKPKVILDYAFSVSNVLLPGLLGRYGAETVVLNAHMTQKLPSLAEKMKLMEQLAEVTVALKGAFGAQLDAHGERMHLCDNRGNIFREERLLALVTQLFMSVFPGSKIAVPVTASSVVERIAARFGGSVIRTKAHARALMEAAKRGEVLFAGSDGRFIWPQFHPGHDAMFTVAKVTEALSKLDATLCEIAGQLPEFYHLHESIPCAWEHKGTVMRVLVERSKNYKVELLDGVKVFLNDHSWVLVLPDPVEPIVHLYADGTSIIETEQLIEDYTELITSITSTKEAALV